jgi:hypothetical protein
VPLLGLGKQRFHPDLPLADRLLDLTIRGVALVDRVCFDGHRATGVRVRTAEGWTGLAGTGPNDLLSDERDLTRLRDGAPRLWAIVRHPAVGAIEGDRG